MRHPRSGVANSACCPTSDDAIEADSGSPSRCWPLFQCRDKVQHDSAPPLAKSDSDIFDNLVQVFRNDIRPLLVVVVARSLLTSLGTHRFEISRLGIECSFILGGIFFLLAFLSAVVDDLLRNWKTQEPTVEWNPQLLWRNFIYVGAVMFFTAAFLAYQQGAWLTVVFLAFSIASLITCEKMFLNHLVMRCSRRERFVG